MDGAEQPQIFLLSPAELEASPQKPSGLKAQFLRGWVDELVRVSKSEDLSLCEPAIKDGGIAKASHHRGQNAHRQTRQRRHTIRASQLARYVVRARR